MCSSKWILVVLSESLPVLALQSMNTSTLYYRKT